MLCESDFIKFDRDKNTIQIQTMKKFIIFQDLFINHKKDYQQLLERCFVEKVMLFVEFNKISSQREEYQENKQTAISHAQTTRIIKTVAGKLDISDKDKWELTHTLLKHFGGTVSDMGKDTHEPDA